MLQAVIDNKPYDFKVITFSDGASSVVALDKLPKNIEEAVLTVKDYPADMYFTLIAQAVEIIERAAEQYVYINLRLPYLPYARADRAFGSNYSNPLSLFFDFLEDVPIDKLTIYDPHNLQAVKDFCCLDLEVVSQLTCFNNTVNRHKDLKSFIKDCNPVICAPDTGAKEKAATIADYYKKDLITCEKVRNPHNGYITGFKIIEGVDVAGRNVIICDDICDGGATFNIAARSLKEAGAVSVTLYVTHGIFSKGIQSLEVDAVYSYQKVNV